MAEEWLIKWVGSKMQNGVNCREMIDRPITDLIDLQLSVFDWINKVERTDKFNNWPLLVLLSTSKTK